MTNYEPNKSILVWTHQYSKWIHTKMRLQKWWTDSMSSRNCLWGCLWLGGRDWQIWTQLVSRCSTKTQDLGKTYGWNCHESSSKEVFDRQHCAGDDSPHKKSVSQFSIPRNTHQFAKNRRLQKKEAQSLWKYTWVCLKLIGLSSLNPSPWPSWPKSRYHKGGSKLRPPTAPTHYTSLHKGSPLDQL